MIAARVQDRIQTIVEISNFIIFTLFFLIDRGSEAHLTESRYPMPCPVKIDPEVSSEAIF